MKTKKHDKTRITDKADKVDTNDKFELGNSISACDCTGLIQVKPADDFELEAYHDVYDFGPTDFD